MAISLLGICAVALLGNHEVLRDKAWMESNMYRVESYVEVSAGKYEVEELKVEGNLDLSFEEVLTTFNSSTYVPYNTPSIETGVNCQGMTVYLADWCEKNNYEYIIVYQRNHVMIDIQSGGEWYRFSFFTEPEVIKLPKNHGQENQTKAEVPIIPM